MLKIIQYHQYNENYELMNKMFSVRAKIFKERLDWDVIVKDGYEKDVFDELNPLYLVSVDKDNKLQGSLRLLPTTGPNMLRNVFGVLIPDGKIESPLIWESSRFCINPEITHKNSDDEKLFVNRVTLELLSGLAEVGLIAGLKFIVTVYDARMARLLKRINCPAQIIGGPIKIGKVMTYASLFEVSENMWVRLGQSIGIQKTLQL
ncbi:acyl-homoserine-lactone synthase [Bartonella tamiae]|uniref:Acyl-homoserine-lactone synthase n=1 Tax=Bartonella tamiae Th239 TaxID=1094558 RepID=J1K0Y5_9HYPH|nr:acyl-homoserine-lactone synthase [Bartonella tamiae]EJF91097.1 hypothetical protein ME5_00429 [Bartonella tamiae Th239]EJF93238.1 hypothetical protein MEG_01452 [Bartonella tamiae Th307]